MMRSQELCSYSEKWERRAEAFAPSVRRAVLNIIKERLEIPPMFAVSRESGMWYGNETSSSCKL